MWWHAQKPDFVFRRNGRVRLNRWGGQFSRLLAAEVSASAVVMLETPCSEVVWRVLATHSIRQFPLHFPSIASPCAITFQLDSTLKCTSTFCRIFRKFLPEYDGVLSLVLRLQLGKTSNRVLIPESSKRYFLFSEALRRALRPTEPPLKHVSVVKPQGP
jgi:hypothetical protein